MSSQVFTDLLANKPLYLEVFCITYTEYREKDLHNSVKYSGQEYDPQLEVFTTPDKKFDKGHAFGFNRHMYVGGNPIMYSDPSGHFAWLIPLGIAMAKGALAGAAIGATSSIISQAAANNWNFKAIDWGKVGQGAAFGAGVGAVTGGAGYFLNSASTVASMGSTLGLPNAAIAQTALNAGSMNMISMYGAGERDFGKLASYFGSGFASGALMANASAAMGLAGNATKNSLAARMLSRYGTQAALSFARSGFNKMVDSKNNLGFSIWGANLSFTKDGLRVSASIPFVATQAATFINGLTGKMKWDWETLALTSDKGVFSRIQDKFGNNWAGFAAYSVFRRTGTNSNRDWIEHENMHVWQSRFTGDDWGAHYMMGLSNGHDDYYRANFFECQAYTMEGESC